MSNYANLAGLLRVLKVQIKTSGSGGLNFDGCFEEDHEYHLDEKDYINRLCHHVYLTTGYCWR